MANIFASVTGEPPVANLAEDTDKTLSRQDNRMNRKKTEILSFGRLRTG